MNCAVALFTCNFAISSPALIALSKLVIPTFQGYGIFHGTILNNPKETLLGCMEFPKGIKTINGISGQV